jgi:hypothetical protein
LSLGVQFGLNKYLEAELKEDRTMLSTKSWRLLLDYAVFADFPPNAEMVSLLLRIGADPRQEFCGCTIWQYVLEVIYLLPEPDTRNPRTHNRLSLVFYNPDHEEWSRIFKLLVEGGADSNVLCMHIKNYRSARVPPKYTALFSTPSRIFSPGGLFPDSELVELLKSWMYRISGESPASVYRLG